MCFTKILLTIFNFVWRQMQMKAASYLGNFSFLVKFLIIFFFVNLLADRYAQLQQVHVVADSFSWSNTFAMSLALPHFWTGLLVPICYLCALWAAANFLQKFEATKVFNPELLFGLRSIGDDLMYGAMAALLLVPSIEAWISLGSRSFQVHWDITAVTIGLLGVVLKLVARRAETLQGQLDSIV